jgi:L-galactose dehydrogenase/L-glyceraldehyde 3-phosphate reductase
MHYRQLGTTGLRVSCLGFGCGAVGGLLVNGDPAEMRQAVARAIDSGVNYFDTAPAYGNGRSEEHLGAALQELRADVIVGTKVRPVGSDFGNIEQAIAQSVEASLRRLRRDRIDLIQLHNPIAPERIADRGWLGSADLASVVAAFERLRQAGKVRFWGINGLGDTDALHTALGCGAQTIQACFNLINPSAGFAVPSGFPFQDYRQLIDHAAARGIGVIAIRVLAAGALSGSAERHANAAQHVEPIASGNSFAADVAVAQRFAPLVAEGYAGSLTEAAIRFAIGKPQVAITLVGISSIAQLEEALTAAERGALPAGAAERIQAIRRD